MDKDSFFTQEIGNYRLVEKLACGSFGCVYRAKHIHLSKLIVAIKVLHTHLASEEAYTQFLQEAQFLAMLKHPHILPIRDMGFLNNEIPYLVLEYCSEGSLQKRISEPGSLPLSLEEAISIIDQVGQGLHFAHQQNVVHRDLKPENILFNTEGKALLADFSIAILLESTKLVDTFGTPPYMAPEVFRGEVSKKSDQYSLGCITYELMTGRKPFTLPHKAPPVAWANVHATVSPVPPRNLNPNIPSNVEQVILKALAKHRDDRFENISAFLDALHPLPKQRYVETINLSNSKWYEETTVANEQAIQVNSKSVNSHANEGEVLNKLKHDEEALTATAQAIPFPFTDAMALYRKSLALYHQRRNREALAASEQAIRLYPVSAEAHHLKGIILYKLKQYKEALAAYDEAIRLNPNMVNAYFSKIELLSKLKRPREILATCDQAIRSNPNEASSIYSRLGYILHDLKRYDEALATYEQAIHLNPESTSLYNSKGEILANRSRNKEAIAAYKQTILNCDQAIWQNKANLDTYNDKGRALEELDRLDNAVGYFYTFFIYMGTFLAGLLFIFNILTYVSIPLFRSDTVNHLSIIDIPITIGSVITINEGGSLYSFSKHIFLKVAEYTSILLIIPIIMYVLYTFFAPNYGGLLIDAGICFFYFEVMFTCLFIKKLIIHRKLRHIETETLQVLY